MVAYDLSNSSEFVGFRTILSGLRVLKARKKDEANPSIKGFTLGTTIGTAPGSTYTELKVFNGTIKGSSLRSLMAELRHKKLWVNRDGYCYMRIPGTKSTRPPQPTKFIRLNDLFAWEDYVDVPTGETFNPTPSSTIWNRFDSSSGDKKVDYEKLDADLKQAENDKKKAEDDKKKAENDKKKAENDKKKAEDDKKKAEEDKKKAEMDKEKGIKDAKASYEDNLKKAKKDYEDKLNKEKNVNEDKLNKAKREYDDKVSKAKKENEENLKKAKKEYEDKVNKAREDNEDKLNKAKKKCEDKVEKVSSDYLDLYDRLNRMKSLWDRAAAIGCLPLHSTAFSINKTPKPRQDTILSKTWMARVGLLTTPPGTLSDNDKTIPPNSLVIYNSIDYFQRYFWWVAKMYFPKYPGYNYLIAFSGNGILENSFDGQIFADKLTCGTNKFPDLFWDVDTIIIKQL